MSIVSETNMQFSYPLWSKDSIQLPVIDQIGNHSEATKIAKQYNVPHIFIPQLETLISNGVLGTDARQAGWDNIGEHCILAGKMALTTSRLVGLSDEDTLFTTQQAYIHDATLRREKEKKANDSTSTNGITQAHVSEDFYQECEMVHPGILQATSMDWRDYYRWEAPMLIMRYVDSCVGPSRIADTIWGRDTMQHWSERTDNLHERKRDISVDIGRKLYGGIPAFKYLATVTADIETILHATATEANPSIFQGRYERPTQFYNLVHNMMYSKYEDDQIVS
ncbi:hypothetical protein BH09PAT2_BH09PAT2_00570 [soil metagenome]